MSAPVPWLVTAQRVTGATAPGPLLAAQLPSSGQVPLVPPNVAGWPGGEAWFASGTVVARVALADALARATAADHPALAAAGAGDHAALARALGLPGPGFGAATTAALRDAGDARAALALALVSPEFVLT